MSHRWLLILVLTWLAGLPAQAQSSVLAGLVYSNTRVQPTATGFDAVEGARITLQGTDLHATTDRLGAFHFENVPPGSYVVEVRKEGWTTATATATVDGSPLPTTVRIQLARPDRPPGRGTIYVAYQERKGFPLKPQQTVPGAVVVGADPLALEVNPPRSPEAPVSLRDNPVSADPDALMLLDAGAPERSKIERLRSHPVWLCFNRSGTVLYMNTRPEGKGPHVLEVVDTLVHKVRRRLPMGGLVTDLRLAPRGDLLLASVRGANPGVHLVDTCEDLPVGFVPLSPYQPNAVALGPNGLLYVAGTAPGGTQGSVQVLTRDGQAVAQAPVEMEPTDLALAPDGSTVYVVNSGSGSVTVLNSALARLRTVGVGAQPQKLALSPDGSRLFVTNRSADTVTVIDAASLTVFSTVDVGDEPIDVAFSQDGAQVYVTCKGDGTIYFLDGRSGQPVHVTHPQPRSSPFGIAVRP